MGDSEPEDEDLRALADMEAKVRAEREAADTAPAKPIWSEAQADQPFADEAPSDPRYEATQETRTAASTGARLPLTAAAALAFVIHAAPPLSALAEKAHLGGAIYQTLPAKAANLWLRTGPARLQAQWEQIALGLLVAGLLLYAVTLAGRRLRVAAQMFAGAVLLNAADWMVFGKVSILHNPMLTADERLAALVLMLVEVALAALLWLRVAPPYRPPSMLKGPRDWDIP
jgi:hypothetical protein